MTTITHEQIQTLRGEAVQAGDFEQVAICDLALDGSLVAIAECERVIADAAARAD